MKRKLIAGCAVAMAAIAIAAGGTTFAAFSDFGDVTGNSAGAGIFKLNLGPGGTGNTPIDFEKLFPGDTTSRVVWVASSDGASVPDANLAVTFHNLVDIPAPCDTSLGKAQGEIDSGVTGCTIVGNEAHGTPAQGNLSRVLNFHAVYYPNITDPTACATLGWPSPYNSIWPADHPGDLYAAASANGGDGTTYQLKQADGTTPLVLSPGEGVCIGLVAYWPGNNNPPGRPSTSYPSDNAAQGDSLSVDVRFDLTQV
jgi:hypothetical protein